MASIVRASKYFSKKDLINSRCATALKDMGEDPMTICKCAQIEREDEDGGKQSVFVLVDIEGNYYSGISSIVYETCGDIIDLLDEDETAVIPVKAVKSSSKAGREFLNILLV